MDYFSYLVFLVNIYSEYGMKCVAFFRYFRQKCFVIHVFLMKEFFLVKNACVSFRRRPTLRSTRARTMNDLADRKSLILIYYWLNVRIRVLFLFCAVFILSISSFVCPHTDSQRIVNKIRIDVVILYGKLFQ